ncbi:TetR/AcrR family transcriptional regulator [Parasulfitobacter algicola]|uniref:TetR/AcrR family transcriptional regulator n=1 Tax=Parasulfitobacter algicola TaxID=2614809 RepID=A0ABX2IUW7_9RHOB|nr:TetR/AcrR family transcriptional regulator [Sulfitobacter algicola]NSX56105.1 TetR/AcrR family transcriptional regulator [Sulfitobacter algicola]
MTDRKQEIIDIASNLFIENGFAGTSINAVAKAAGIQKASLYHHFPSKEALFLSCVGHGYPDHIEKMKIYAEDITKPHAERLELMLNEFYDAMIYSNAGRMSSIIAETTRRFPQMARDFHDQFIEEMDTSLRNLLTDGITAGAFEDVDVDGFDYIFCSTPVHLSLSRAMFACFDDLEERFNVEKIKKAHWDALKALLKIDERAQTQQVAALA